MASHFGQVLLNGIGIPWIPVKDTVVTNDRWGSDTSCAHGGFYTCQSQPTTLPTHKWENVVSADKSSRGYRRTMKLDDVYSSDELIAQLAQTISLGGNFVLNINIDANGRVLPVFEERLKNLGDFVTDHSDAIFSSKPWIYQSDVDSVVYTSQLKNPNNLDPYRLYNPQQQNNTVIYAFVTNWPDDNLVNLTRVVPTSQTTINLLHAGPGTYSSVPFSQTSTGILVDISNVSISNFPSSNYVSFDTFVLKIENAADQCPVNWIQNSINQQECLTFGNSTLGWNAANSQCGALGPGATLTSINSVFENSVIQDLNQGCSNAYIGLYRNSSSSNWQWINGDTSTYTNWGPDVFIADDELDIGEI
uniref:alpha-L-fucosidase n=1 Tax=Acrobeloides nanus TaxID=290746 RepID=A0A914DS32_9BILA